MEEGPPSPTTLVVSSPRRTLSLLRNRRASAFTSSSDSAFLVHDKQVSTDERSGGGLTGEHGPKTSEVYGFVGSITTVIATVIYLVWAYTPEPWLHSLGITYYPSKYWALGVPSFLIVTVFLMVVLYLGLNFLATPPPYSLNMNIAVNLAHSHRQREWRNQLTRFQMLELIKSTFLCLAIQISSIKVLTKRENSFLVFPFISVLSCIFFSRGHIVTWSEFCRTCTVVTFKLKR